MEVSMLRQVFVLPNIMSTHTTQEMMNMENPPEDAGPVSSIMFLFVYYKYRSACENTAIG